MLIPLICKQCGGKLEVEESHVIKSDDMLVVLNDQTFKCTHCGVSHFPGEKLKQMPSVSFYINGNISGGSFVIGNNNVIGQPLPQSAPVADQPLQSKSEEEVNQQKKWWEFWKK